MFSVKTCLNACVYMCLMAMFYSCNFSNMVDSTRYYIDSEKGNDFNDGTAPDKAWKTLVRVNNTDFNPGDCVLFKGKQEFSGRITLNKYDSGTPSKNVIVSSYGEGCAIIDGGNSSALFVDSCKYLIIRNLKFVGSGRKNGNKEVGVMLLATQNVTVDQIEVSGFLKAGIMVSDDQDTRITNVYAHNNGFAGIYAYSWKVKSKNLYIAHCVAENNPGDPTNLTNHSGNGIVISGVQCGVIEYCEAMNNGWDMPREGNGPVGIWAWNSDSVIIQYCISHDNKTSPKGKDGGGFDFDGGVTNSIIQYNYSYNNEGAGIGLFQYIDANIWENNIIRYNICVNDGSKNGHCGVYIWSDENNDNTMYNAEIYNNTIINTEGHAVGYLTDIPGLKFYNNIFVTGNSQIYGPYSKSRYENNLYWSTSDLGFNVEGYKSIEEWGNVKGQEKLGDTLVGRFADPKLILPDPIIKKINDPTKLTKLTAYKLREDSPGVGNGLYIQNNGGLDFWGNKLPDKNMQPDIGAHQMQR